MEPLTPMQRADRIHWEFRSGQVGRATAIAAFRAILDVTELGAGEMLDNPIAPTTRIAQGGRTRGGLGGVTFDGDHQ